MPVSKYGRILKLKNSANIPLEGTAQRYVLTTPTSAVVIESAPRKVISVPNKSLVDVEAPVNGSQGLVEVKLNGATVLMFAEDILRPGKKDLHRVRLRPSRNHLRPHASIASH